MLQTITPLLIFLFPLAYSPGPGNVFFAANGARFGFRATIPANLGYHLATWPVTAAIGLGLVTTMEEFPQVFQALKLAGAAYVLWIAWAMFRAGDIAAKGDARPARILDGVILLLLNPKAYVIIALMFSRFLGPDAASPLAGVLLIATIFTLNNLVAFSVWTLAGDRLAALFRSPANARRLNRLFGAILAVVALWMLIT